MIGYRKLIGLAVVFTTVTILLCTSQVDQGVWQQVVGLTFGVFAGSNAVGKFGKGEK